MRARSFAVVSLLTVLGCGPKPTTTPTAASSAVAPGPSTEEIQDGVFFHERAVDRDAGSMRVWMYAPSGTVDGPVGCVLVPPAGSDLMSGKKLTDEDRAEHVPYVEAGYVVVAFDIDGPLDADVSGDEALERIAEFRRAEAGVANAQAALDLALETYPSIDPARIYTAGHSSAATLALLFAAKEPRVKAVAAYAPVTDVVAWVPAASRQALEQVSAGYGDFLQDSSPMSHTAELAAKPVFLFSAADDGVVKKEQTQRLFDAMKDRHPASERKVVESGGHYDSMIREGIPAAIAWFRGLEDGAG